MGQWLASMRARGLEARSWALAQDGPERKLGRVEEEKARWAWRVEEKEERDGGLVGLDGKKGKGIFLFKIKEL